MLLLTRGTFAGFLVEYLVFYLPTLVLFLLIPVEVYFNIPNQEQNRLYSIVIPSSVAFSALLLLLLRLKGQPAKVATYYSLAYLNFMTVLWLLVFELGIARVWEHNLPQSITLAKQQVIEAIALSFLGLVCHASMAWHRFSFRVLLGFAALIVYLLQVYPGYAEIGAAALRDAQLGGGTRISYTLVGSRSTPPEPAAGCLVLATSSYVLISDPVDDKCFSLIRFAFTSSQDNVRPVRVFSRTEIVFGKVSG